MLVSEETCFPDTSLAMRSTAAASRAFHSSPQHLVSSNSALNVHVCPASISCIACRQSPTSVVMLLVSDSATARAHVSRTSMRQLKLGCGSCASMSLQLSRLSTHDRKLGSSLRCIGAQKGYRLSTPHTLFMVRYTCEWSDFNCGTTRQHKGLED